MTVVFFLDRTSQSLPLPPRSQESKRSVFFLDPTSQSLPLPPRSYQPKSSPASSIPQVKVFFFLDPLCQSLLLPRSHRSKSSLASSIPQVNFFFFLDPTNQSLSLPPRSHKSKSFSSSTQQIKVFPFTCLLDSTSVSPYLHDPMSQNLVLPRPNKSKSLKTVHGTRRFLLERQKQPGTALLFKTISGSRRSVQRLYSDQHRALRRKPFIALASQ